MFNYRAMAILKREIRQQIMTKRFIIMTLSFPLIMMLMIGLQVFIVSFDKDDKATLHVLNESVSMQNLIQQQFESSDLNDPELYELEYRLVELDELDAYVDERRGALLGGAITGIVYIPETAYEDKGIIYYSNNPGNQNINGRLREHVNKALVGDYFRELNIDTSAVDYARSNISIDGIRVTEEGTASEGPGNLIVAGVLTFLLYMNLLMVGPIVLGAVNEEKTNRVVEVMLSSVTPTEILYGKVFGTAITGLAQMAIWMSPLLLLILNGLPYLGALAELNLQVNVTDVLYFLLNYFIALLTFLSIFAAFGAMFDNPQDAQGATGYVMFLIIIPFFLAMSMARNPANALAEVSSMLPFASLMVMPARMTLIDIPSWQLLVAMISNVLTLYLAIRAGAKLYRTTILMTGKKPGWKEIYKWLRYE